MRYKCKNCGTQTEGNPLNCPDCGNTVFTPVQDKSGKTKVEIDTGNGVIRKIRNLFKT